MVHIPQAKITALPNGLRVATERLPHVDQSASVGVWIAAGSRYETPQNNGSAHFVEHLAFKGTSSRSREALEKEVEAMGGRFNAYTSRETTAYYLSSAAEDVPQAVDILADVLLRSSFSKESIEAERGTIQTEEKEVYKCLQEYTMDYLHETAYPRDPLGQTILGPAKNVAALKREDLLDYVRRHYIPERMVLAGAGAIEHGELVELAAKYFGGMRRGGAAAPQMKPAQYIGGDYRERQDSLPLAHVALAYQSTGWSDPDVIPLLFMHALLGTYDKDVRHSEHSISRLISTLGAYKYVEKMMPFNTLYTDTGLFGVYIASYEGRLFEAVSCILRAIKELFNHITDQHVDEVRNKLACTLFDAYGTTEKNVEELARQVLVYGRKIPHGEFLARLNAVDSAAVRAAAKRFIYDQDHTMSAVGPIVELQGYPFVRRRSYSYMH